MTTEQQDWLDDRAAGRYGFAETPSRTITFGAPVDLHVGPADLHTTDAEVWARECARVLNAEIGDGISGATGDLLHTWFANAIKAGRAAGRAEAEALADLAPELRGVLPRLIDEYGLAGCHRALEQVAEARR